MSKFLSFTKTTLGQLRARMRELTLAKGGLQQLPLSWQQEHSMTDDLRAKGAIFLPRTDVWCFLFGDVFPYKLETVLQEYNRGCSVKVPDLGAVHTHSHSLCWRRCIRLWDTSFPSLGKSEPLCTAGPQKQPCVCRSFLWFSIYQEEPTCSLALSSVVCTWHYFHF